MPVARHESSDSRVIAHIDMDCFYVQVEQRKQPDLRGSPTAVVQYNEWKGGGLIAVSYEARKYGVKRSMRGDEAKQVCPQIHLVQVPVARGKADLNTYRDAGAEVVSILARKGRCERASIDEVYLDLTDAAETMLAETPPERLEAVAEEAGKSHILGLNHENGADTKENVREWLCRSEADLCDKLLACGALIVAELRMQVLKETEFTCSAGIAHNKILAKLSSAMNKPAQQTVVPSSSVEGLLESLPIKKMKHLGGKLGSSLQNDLGASTVGDLLQFSKDRLQESYGINTGTWLWNIARGISGEEVQGRLLPKSHGSGKTFPGPRALKTIASVQHWLNELCDELSERLQSDLEKNKRIAQTLTLHVRAYKSSDMYSVRNFPSKSCPLRYGTAKIQEDALNLFQSGLREYIGSFGTKGNQKSGWRVTGLSVSASKYFSIPSGTCPIMKYFSGHYVSHSSNQSEDDHSLKKSQDEPVQESVLPSPSGNKSYSELNFTKQQMEVTGEDMKNPCCLSLKLAHDDCTEETSLSTSGTESCCGIDKTQQQRASSGEEPFNIVTKSCYNRPKQEIDILKDKGTYSIFRFFKRNDPCCSSEMQDMTGNVDVNAPSSSHTELPNESFLEAVGTSNYSSSSVQSDQSRTAWSYKIDEIDTSVIDELPHEIQEEVRAWLRPHKRQNANRKGSSIANYFFPTKKT